MKGFSTNLEDQYQLVNSDVIAALTGNDYLKIRMTYK